MRIRLETESDIASIRAVHLQSFPDASEADLVDALRLAGDIAYSVIAEDGGAVVASAVFSRLAKPSGALALAPVAVLPEFRKQGLADRVIREGLAQARSGGWNAAFVLGNPSYYQRFGFDLKLAEHFECEYSGAHFMAMALARADLTGMARELMYPAAFSDLD